MGNRIGNVKAAVLAGILLVRTTAWSQTARAGEEPAHAPRSEGGTVIGHGQVTLRPLPTALQLNLWLSAKGENAEKAVARLKQRQRAASDQLEKLGANKKSIRHQSLSIAQGDSEERRRLQQMIRQRMRGARQAGKTSKGPKTVKVTSLLSAEFPLTAKDADEAFLAAHRLKDQVKAAKLAVSAEDEKLSAEGEEEAGDEDDSDPFGRRGRDPNVPTISYLARISREAQAKAMAEAFEKAKEDAATSACAARVEPGALMRVENHVAPTRDTSGPDSEYRQSRRYGPAVEEDNEEGEGEEPQEAQGESVAPEPGQVAFQVTATAIFRIGGTGNSPKTQER